MKNQSIFDYDYDSDDDVNINEAILTGIDRRQLNLRYMEYPFNCIGLLTWIEKIHAGGFASYMATAFLVSPCLIVTAAHNVVSSIGSRFGELKFYPAINGSIDQNQTQGNKVVGLKICENYVHNPNRPGGDFAMASLEKNVLLPQYIKLAKSYPFIKQGIIYGYPLDRNQREDKKEKEEGKKGLDKRYRQFGMKGQICEIISQKNKVRHKMDTTGGQSGSPILVEAEGEWYAIGIHNKEVAEGQKQFNVGLYLSPKVMKIIQIWLQELTNKPKISSIKSNTIRQNNQGVFDVLDLDFKKQNLNVIKKKQWLKDLIS